MPQRIFMLRLYPHGKLKKLQAINKFLLFTSTNVHANNFPHTHFFALLIFNKFSSSAIFIVSFSLPIQAMSVYNGVEKCLRLLISKCLVISFVFMTSKEREEKMAIIGALLLFIMKLPFPCCSLLGFGHVNTAIHSSSLFVACAMS